MDFPYKSTFYPSYQNMFKNLMREKLDLNSNVLIRNYETDDEKCDGISSHFTEHVRIRCSFQGKETPYSVWQRIGNSFESYSKREQREIVYANSKECNAFNPMFVKFIMLKLSNKLGQKTLKVIDPSSGWGDRLIGCGASKVVSEYQGYDPNVNLKHSYTKIIKSFKFKNYNVKDIPFEDVIVKEDYYDVALTSPPYFTLETYVPVKEDIHNRQSSSRYTTYEAWIRDMYSIYLRNMCLSVKKGGFVCIYVSNYVDRNKKLIPLADDTKMLMEKRFGMSFYDEFILNTGSNSNRICYVWEKTK